MPSAYALSKNVVGEVILGLARLVRREDVESCDRGADIAHGMRDAERHDDAGEVRTPRIGIEEERPALLRVDVEQSDLETAMSGTECLALALVVVVAGNGTRLHVVGVDDRHRLAEGGGDFRQIDGHEIAIVMLAIHVERNPLNVHAVPPMQTLYRDVCFVNA